MNWSIDPSLWNKQCATQEHSPFLQSYEWGVFQEKRGFAVRRFESDSGYAHAFKYPLIGGRSYWYAPYHPILTDDGYAGFFRDLSGQKGKSVFIRYEPLESLPDAQKSEELTPSTTLILSLVGGKEALLSEMHSKTRYNSTLGAKKGVEIAAISPVDTEYSNVCESVIRLFRTTGERHAFRVQTPEYFRMLLSSFPHEGSAPHRPWIRLYYAKYRDTLLGAILVMYFGDTATYLYGGSSPLHREVMAPHALQLAAIQDALQSGYRYYDFWGIAPHDDPRHPWAGITRFKKGFGGEVYTRPGTFDYVINRTEYAIYGALRKIRRMIGRAQKI